MRKKGRENGGKTENRPISRINRWPGCELDECVPATNCLGRPTLCNAELELAAFLGKKTTRYINLRCLDKRAREREREREKEMRRLKPDNQMFVFFGRLMSQDATSKLSPHERRCVDINE